MYQLRTILCCLCLLCRAAGASAYSTWNRYCIIITGVQPADTAGLALRLQLPGYAPAGVATFVDAVRSGDLSVAWYQGSMVLLSQELAYDMLSPQPSALEGRLIALFPRAEIITVIGNSTSYYFGYAVIKEGKRLRLKEGGDGEVFRAIGAPIPEEDKTAATDLFSADELSDMHGRMMTQLEINRLTNFEAAWHVSGLLAAHAFADGFDGLTKATYIRYTRK